MNIENTFSELKKKEKKTLFYYQHLAVSLFLIIFWWPCNDYKTFCETAGTLNIYFIWTLDILFMQYK